MIALCVLTFFVKRPVSVVIVSQPSRQECRPQILVAHEQHLQDVGSDRRVLALLRQLRERSTVSLLFRKAAPPARRSPKTADLAAFLGVSSPVHALRLDETPPMPPAIYELGDTPSLTSLLRIARFDFVLVGLWFW